MRSLLVALGLVSLAGSTAAGQERAPITLRVSTSALFESNLPHATAARPAYGGVASVGVSLQDRDRRPRLKLDYETALHRYSTATPFQRTSHAATGEVALGLAPWLSWESRLGMSLRGSSEDRELNNQYQAKQRLEMSLARGSAVRLSGSVRLKRYPEPNSAGRDATNRYLEAEVLQRLVDGGRLTLGMRLEENDAKEARYGYRRTTWSMELASAQGGWQQLQVGLAYRVQRYSSRRVKDRDVLRRDYRLNPEVRWTVRPGVRSEITLGYDYENRSSNDPGQGYEAHRLSLGVTRWW